VEAAEREGLKVWQMNATPRLVEKLLGYVKRSGLRRHQKIEAEMLKLQLMSL
jgi:hypothetical protein